MLGSASASIWRSMPSTIRATKTPTITRRPVRSNESVFTMADYASLQFAQIDLIGADGADVLLRPSAGIVQGCCRNHYIAADQLLRLGERAVIETDAVPRILVSTA